MRRTPPDEDGQIQPSRSSNPPSRRQSALERQNKDYYSDEHPEIPKVKRASLYLPAVQAEPEPTVTQRPRSRQRAAPLDEPEPTVTQRPRQRQRAAPLDELEPTVTQRPRQRQRAAPLDELEPTVTQRPRQRAVPLDEPDDFPEEDEADAVYATGKIVVEKSRRPNVYTPQPAAYAHARERRRERPLGLLAVIQRTPHYRGILIAGIVALVLIVIIVSINRTLTPTSSSPTSSVPDTIASTNIQQPLADPYELVISPPNNNHPAPPVFATSAYLLDADTGVTLYASNPFMHLPMLSTTKLMTALLASELGNPEQKITINDAMANDISHLSADSAVINVKKGESYTLRDLLYGLLLMSGNDAAIVIGDALAGNLTNFVAKMNQRAAQLGLHDTHYLNPHGLLMTGHYSSAHDLAFLGKVVLSIPLIHQISSTKQYHVAASADHPEHFFINGNQFLWWYPGVDGGKTGWDAGTDFIQVMSVVRNNHHLIGVVMHTNDWWTDMRDLMNWGFSSFTWISPRDQDAVSTIPFDTDWNDFAKDQKTNTVPFGSQGKYYIYTGYSITGVIKDYFDKNNGLATFGFPASLPAMANDTTISQHFALHSIQCNLQSQKCITQ